MIAHDAAKYYIAQPNTYSVLDMRQKFKGELLIEGGKAHIVFFDESTLSVQKLVQANFNKGDEDENPRISV